MTTKICTKCGEEKELIEFSKNGHNKSGYRSYCRKCASIYYKEWRLNNREQYLEGMKNWRENNKERHLKVNRNWKLNNKERNLELSRKDKAKRKRNFGYIPLNNKFPGSVGHHISKDCVVYIPEELHKSIPHRYDDPISMGQINILALEYLP